MTGELRFGSWRGEPSITLVAGERRATFLPGCGMLCASLRHRDTEFVAWPRSLAEFRTGRMTAVPLVHPWGNRLARWGYRARARTVDLRGVDLPTDPNGLPMHGNLRGAPFAVRRVDAGTRGARIEASLDYGARPDLLRAFPFPHVVTVLADLDERRLRVDTEIRPTGRTAVPVSFCWHPFVRLPGAPRRRWELRWPACERLLVDDRVLPTGASVAQASQRAPLGSRTFDDHYALGADRRFALRTAAAEVELRFGPAYPYAQLYVPARGNFAAIEPMTATIDALGKGATPFVGPGDRFAAWFTVSGTAA